MIAFAALLVGSLLSTAGVSYPTSSPTVQAAKSKPVPRLICKVGTAMVRNTRASATGGCTFGGKRVGSWSWVNQTVDAAGTPCPMAATSGTGSSFEPKPAAQVTPVFTLSVPKTRFYRAKVLRVGGHTLTTGWDSCGTPLEVVPLPPGDDSPLCKYLAPHSFDAATRTLTLGKVVGCPREFGECKWVPVPPDKWYSPYPGVTIYGGVIRCSNGNIAITYALLNSGCVRIDATGSFVIPDIWAGKAYWDISILTTDSNWQPLQVNVIPPGQYGAGDPAFNGFMPYQHVDAGTLHGSKPFC